MNFKAFGYQAAVATVAVAGVAMATSPAQAFSFGDELNLAGESRLEVTGSTATLNFDDNIFFGLVNYTNNVGKAVVGASSAAAFGPGSAVTVKDLTLQQVGSNWVLASPVTNFLSLTNGIKYSLNSFALKQVSGGSVPSFEANFSGVFTPFAVGNGLFTTQGKFTFNPPTSLNGSTYSASINVIPTPAMLPGVIGMGLAALRKRKSQAAEKTEA
jgi:hypothetical protein